MTATFTGQKDREHGPDKFMIAAVPAGLRLTLSAHETVSGFFDPQDAPRIALEILKAAGAEPRAGEPVRVGSIADATWQLHLAVAAAESDEAANKARQKRRDDLAAEFTAFHGYDGATDSLRRAIDRIIELEDAAA